MLSSFNKVFPVTDIFFFDISGADGSNRRLAYSDIGDKSADDLMLCIPGLLETRETFAPLLDAAHQCGVVRVVSIDLCARGDSDPLPASASYSMQQYLHDLEIFLSFIKSTHATRSVRVHLLGTSMGGILAMYMAIQSRNAVSSVILNDIGLSLSWWSIYKLYGKMGKEAMVNAGVVDVQKIARNLNVRPEVVQAVQEPTHFDLPYKSDLIGMRFGSMIREFQGRVYLIHAKDSVICTAIQVDEFLKRYPPNHLLEVPGAQHPAPYDPLVCEFVLGTLNLSQPHSRAQAAAKPAHSPPELLQDLSTSDDNAETKATAKAAMDISMRTQVLGALNPQSKLSPLGGVLNEQLPLFASSTGTDSLSSSGASALNHTAIPALSVHSFSDADEKLKEINTAWVNHLSSLSGSSTLDQYALSDKQQSVNSNMIPEHSAIAPKPEPPTTYVSTQTRHALYSDAPETFFKKIKSFFTSLQRPNDKT